MGSPTGPTAPHGLPPSWGAWDQRGFAQPQGSSLLRAGWSRDGDPQERASRCSRDTKGTQRGHRGEQPRLRSAPGAHPSPSTPPWGQQLPRGRGTEQRGSRPGQQLSGGHGTGPGHQPRCAEHRMPGAVPARPGSSPVLPHYFYPAVAIETPDPLAMMQPLSEALDHQLLLPPTAHGAGGRYFWASAEPPPQQEAMSPGGLPGSEAEVGTDGGGTSGPIPCPPAAAPHPRAT